MALPFRQVNKAVQISFIETSQHKGLIFNKYLHIAANMYTSKSMNYATPALGRDENS